MQIANRKRTLIFINLVISCFASSMLATALTTALPPIIRDLGISVTTGQWLTSGFALTLAIIMPLTAFCINRFPTKRLYEGALLLFLAGLIICACSINFPMMMLGRVIQAAGNGMLMSMAQVIILSLFPPAKRGSAMGWYGLSLAAAPVIAPTLAGVMVDTVGWRMFFFIVFAVMAIAFIVSLFVFENVLETVKKKFDIPSFILSTLAFGGITLGIGNIGSYGFVSIITLLPLGIGILAAIFFIYRELHMEDPMLNLKTFKYYNFTVGIIGCMLVQFILMGTVILMPLYIQETLGYSATVSGLVILPGSILMAIMSPFTGRLYDKIGIKILFIAGAIGLTLSTMLMIFVRTDTALWIPVVVNAFRNIAMACIIMPVTTWSVSSVSPKMLSHATALINSLRSLGGAIGSAVFVAVMTFATNRAVSSGSFSGQEASMHGVNIAFLGMTMVAIIFLLISIFLVRGKKKAKALSSN